MNKIKKYINFKKQYKKPRLQKIFKKNHEIKIYTLKKNVLVSKIGIIVYTLRQSTPPQWYLLVAVNISYISKLVNKLWHNILKIS